MHRFPFLLLLALGLAGDPAGAQAPLPRKVQSIEGVTEYRLANGLRVLTIPDASADTFTVHVTYFVGSRHEGYGEKGMAHLLEHMLFKGSANFKAIKEEFARRGARWNGTTSNDRTTYFETLAATDDNLRWALAMEADRMVRSFVSKSDLDSEMTVVRNEFELGENSPGSILLQRMQQLAFPLHNYGNPVIGARSDIENVPIARLQAFYRTWYQPDNALLILAGHFDEARALQLVAKDFGAIPRPQRRLPALYTSDPAQDGERAVTLRRAGDTQMVSALYRVPAGSHPDYPALDMVVHVLGTAPSGRLHRALVQKGLASSVWGSERALHDPGFAYFGAALGKEAVLERARDVLLATVEGLRAEPVRADELERARTALLNDFERAQLDSGSLVRVLSEFAATGDWRLFFLYRDRLRGVTLADAQRVAETYLRPANRVLGLFVPTAQPERAEIPPTPDLAAALAGYRSDAGVAAGETFDPSPQNIEQHVQRRELTNGIRVALLPKKTRGGRVYAALVLHWGDEASRAGRETACSLAGSMLVRGSAKHSRAEIRDAFEALNASTQLGAGGASIEVRRANLEPALRLAAEVLREPAFPAAEFEELKRSLLTGAEAQRSDPSTIARVELSRHLSPYPKDHPFYTQTTDEQIETLRATTLDAARSCYRDLIGATGADFVAVGDFDPDALVALVQELFGGWASPRPFARIPVRYFERPALERASLTPDKANAVLRGGASLPMRDDDPDFPAMVLANYLLGGSSTARLPQRIREKEGLSYSTFSLFSADWFEPVASFGVSAIFAPQNRARVERAIREELERAVREGFSPAEIEAGKKGLLAARRQARTQDRALAGRLGDYLFAKRTFAWDIEFERRIAALTPAQVGAALRRHLDPARLSVVAAGDFKAN